MQDIDTRSTLNDDYVVQPISTMATASSPTQLSLVSSYVAHASWHLFRKVSRTRWACDHTIYILIDNLDQFLAVQQHYGCASSMTNELGNTVDVLATFRDSRVFLHSWQTSINGIYALFYVT